MNRSYAICEEGTQCSHPNYDVRHDQWMWKKANPQLLHESLTLVYGGQEARWEKSLFGCPASIVASSGREMYPYSHSLLVLATVLEMFRTYLKYDNMLHTVLIVIQTSQHSIPMDW